MGYGGQARQFARQVGYRVHVQDREDVASMRAHGQWADAEQPGDLLAGKATSDASGDIFLL
jgi:hypothetical protein